MLLCMRVCRFQLVSESLCDISDKRRYDKIYLNSGHMAYYPPARQRAFVTESIANLDALKRCASKLVFLDHPPQNFYFREGNIHSYYIHTFILYTYTYINIIVVHVITYIHTYII